MTTTKTGVLPAHKTRDVIPLEPRGCCAPAPLNTQLGCNSCGACCRQLSIPISPDELNRREERDWRDWQLAWENQDADDEPGLDEPLLLLGAKERESARLEAQPRPEPVWWDDAQRDAFFEEHLLPNDFPDKLVYLRQQRDLIVIARMLRGRCQGVWKAGSLGKSLDLKTDRFVYGPCLHLQEQEDGTARCGIYETRPVMCSGFPFDNGRFYIDGAIYKGCGYHLDPEFGLSVEEGQAGLVPLESYLLEEDSAKMKGAP